MVDEYSQCSEGVFVASFQQCFSYKVNLYKRKITDDPLCPICGVEVESTRQQRIFEVWESDTKKERRSQ
jgi:hypothetical protein